MRIEYVHRYSDNVAFQEYLIETNPVVKKQTRRASFLLILSYILLMLAFLSLTEYDTPAVIISGVLSLIFIPLFILYMGKYNRNHAIGLYKRMHKETDDNRELSTVASIDGDTITVESQRSKLVMKLNEIKRIDRYKGYIYLLTSEISAIVLRQDTPSVEPFIKQIESSMTAVRGSIPA